ncbi:MAG: PAS domain-containing protein [Betaproteobacteria bacterium]|nr:PAS domain-containing protein [Betaproteobacteria bacterium]
MTRPAPPLRRHLLLLVLFSSIPAFALVAFNGWREYAHLRDTATERALAAANAIVREQRELIAQTRELLAALAALPEISSKNFTACSKELREFIRLSGAYENIGVFAADGAMVCSAKPLSQAVNVADMPYFRRTLETRRFVVGDYHVSQATHRPVFTMSAPIFDARGELAGVILAAVSTDWFERQAAAIGLPHRHALTVLDSAFNVIARHPGNQWIGRNVSDGPLATLLRSAKSEGTAEVAGLSGEARFVAYVPLQADQGGNRIFVVIGARIDELYREARITLVQNLIALLLALSVVAAGAWLEADRLVLRHVHNLIRAIEKLRSGKSDARVASGGASRELAVLGQAFNDMAAELHEREAERKQAEEAILQAQLRYQTLFEQSPVGIVVVDLDSGLAVECNAVAHNELGYSKEEFLRLRVSDYEALESPAEIKAHTEKILRQGEIGSRPSTVPKAASFEASTSSCAY